VLADRLVSGLGMKVAVQNRFEWIIERSSSGGPHLERFMTS
jgi:hypothetical protein